MSWIFSLRWVRVLPSCWAPPVPACAASFQACCLRSACISASRRACSRSAPNTFADYTLRSQRTPVQERPEIHSLTGPGNLCYVSLKAIKAASACAHRKRVLEKGRVCTGAWGILSECSAVVLSHWSAWARAFSRWSPSLWLFMSISFWRRAASACFSCSGAMPCLWDWICLQHSLTPSSYVKMASQHTTVVSMKV